MMNLTKEVLAQALGGEAFLEALLQHVGPSGEDVTRSMPRFVAVLVAMLQHGEAALGEPAVLQATRTLRSLLVPVYPCASVGNVFRVIAGIRRMGGADFLDVYWSVIEQASSPEEAITLWAEGCTPFMNEPDREFLRMMIQEAGWD